MKYIGHILCLMISALTLVACGSSQYYTPNLFAHNMPTGIDGEWADQNGIISSFRDGIFETRAADTKEKLSEGTYNYVNARHVELEVRSILRGKVSRASCTVSNDKTLLSCMSNASSQFFLKRKT
ncbi:outer membrane lipoprotein precursor [Bartonella australis AUST/NH1]|uniref:Outer membrane lipoprotein n=1 Tax=Bartonella australis (strain Aust/NH1) TaxID=1094489 RepID=M1PC31_BARAA|nr:hypothetical protein [Bartonella australis]AGF74186.1 outer membrane lipoprotein precursor [Bartonella australis AUST/NH1]